MMISCNDFEKKKENKNAGEPFEYFLEQFADLKIMRYQVPEFDSLNLKQKKLVYYLSQAALCGRDILYDQHYKYNLAVRRTLETIYETYKGNRNTPEFNKFLVYLKRVWFSNGIHHHYSTDKFLPEFSSAYFGELLKNIETSKLPLERGEATTDFIKKITDIIFNPEVASKRLNQDAAVDMVHQSACNFYEGVTQKEVEEYYNNIRNKNDTTPVSYGLNSKVVKESGRVVEKLWKEDGMYGAAIKQIDMWLEKAVSVAENEKQKSYIEKLIAFYKTGDLKTWDDCNIEWVEDKDADIDFVNGFIEVYADPMAMKATWESVVNFKDKEATRRTEIISKNAQWFEDHSPVDPKFRKKEVKGVTAKVITVAQLGGDCYPSTPIGINLPNADWIRKEHGSKSVTLENITYAYDKVSLKSGFLEEFAASEEEIELTRKYGTQAGNVHTDLHECLGHGSGQMLPGITAEMLKSFHSTIEEARADLFALYYMMDPKITELGILPSTDAAKAEYMGYIRNGLLTQMVRILPGKDIEEAHMRNRQLIAKWCYEKGQKDHVIEFFKKENKTFIRINDYDKLRQLFGELLKEIQRVKSEGDYEAAKSLVENYGIKLDPALHAEVYDRYKKLNLAPYGGFINPELVPVEQNGEIIDVKVLYPDDYSKQMLEYSKKYSFLPTYN